jgi:hypothetical protein
MNGRTLLLVVIAVLGAAFAWRSLEEAGSAQALATLCSVASQPEHPDFRSVSLDGLQGDDVAAGVECLCGALVYQGRVDECVRAVTNTGAPVPSLPVVAQQLVPTFVDAGDRVRAFHAAWNAIADDPVTSLENASTAIRASVDHEGEEAMLRRCGERLVSGRPFDHLTNVCAVEADRNNRTEDGLRWLGTERPKRLIGAWFNRRANLLATAGRFDALEAHIKVQIAAGVSEAEAEAIWGVSLYGAIQPGSGVHFEKAWARRLELPPYLRSMVANRLIQQAIVSGFIDKARAIAEAARASKVEGVQLPKALEASATTGPAILRFESDGPGVLLLSPADVAGVDAGYDAHPIDAGAPVIVARGPERHPLRYVLRRAERVVASGSVWPRPGESRKISVAPHLDMVVQPPTGPERAEGDGWSKIVVFVVDSGDWRIVQYGRALGLWPTLQGIVDGGARGVLHSDPPSTAIAMQKLVEPGSTRPDTMMDLRTLGRQVQVALEATTNPLDGLRLLSRHDRLSMPEALAVRGQWVANLLYSHGGIAAGGNATIIGPGQRRRALQASRASRPLRPHEGVAVEGRGAILVSELERAAQQLDDVEALLVEDRADVILYRYDPTDVLAHNGYATFELDGPLVLPSDMLDAYTFLDQRLRTLSSRLDSDDLLIVVSDHGTENASNHSVESLLIVHGPVEPRELGTVGFEVVPLFLLDLVCASRSPVLPDALPYNHSCARWAAERDERGRP